MPRYYWDSPEQAKVFIEAVSLATHGVVKGRRSGKTVQIPHGARHGMSYEVEKVARILDEQGPEAVLEYARESLRIWEEIKDETLEETLAKISRVTERGER